MILDTPKSFKPENKDIKYLNRDFSQLKQSLMDFAKTYYPNTYKDFSEASTGMMFMEMAAYVGDVLSYYIDYQFKESGKFWSGYDALFEGMPLSEEVIKNEVNKFSLGSNAEAFWKLGWKPKTNIEELMIDTMKKNYELITK